MKKTVAYLGLFLGCLAYGQQQPAPKKYDLKLEDVTTKSEAKMVTDALRSYINPAGNPFAYFPVFYDDRDAFLFNTEREINEDELRAYLKDKYNLQLIYCKQVK